MTFTRGSSSVVLSFAAALAAPFLVGCATPELTSTAGEPLVETETTSTITTLDLRSAYPLSEGTQQWEIVDGRDAGSTQTRRRTVTELFGADLAVTLGEARTQYWTSTDHAIAMTATHAHDDRAISLFDPPLPIGPESLERGVTDEQSVSMTVVDDDDHEQVKQRGTATRRVTWVDDVSVETSAGTMTAHRIETVFLAELNLARAEEKAVLLFVPQLGFVHEDRVESIRAMGIFSRTTRQTLRREID